VPGGAVAGRAEIMSDLAFRSDNPDFNRNKRVRHQGTFSANPITAAVGVAAMEILKDGQIQKRCMTLADRLKAGFSNALREAGAAGSLYGAHSTMRLIVGDDLPKIYDSVAFSTAVPAERLLQNVKQPLLKAMQCAQLLEGIDILGCTHGWTSAIMTEKDIDEAVARWERALHRVIAEGYLSGKAKIFATA